MRSQSSIFRPHGSLQSSVLTVLADEDVGGAVDVEVGGHARRTSSTADRALQAVIATHLLRELLRQGSRRANRSVEPDTTD